MRSKIASTFSNKQSRNFWSVIRSLNESRGKTNHVPIVDGVTGVNDIVNLFASKLNSRLNTHPGISANAFHSFDSSLFASQLSEVNVSVNDVLSTLESLKPGKTDSDRVSSNHLKFAIPVMLSLLFFLYCHSPTWIYA